MDLREGSKTLLLVLALTVTVVRQKVICLLNFAEPTRKEGVRHALGGGI
jgi:hypothetical protein